MDLATLWLVMLIAWLFVLGAAVGSFLNVCIYRLPLGKPISWPGSRCGSCLTKIPASENIPILGYWMLRGRCPRCGATFSMRYFGVELLTGLAFAAIYAAEVGSNSLAYPAWGQSNWWRLAYMQFPPRSWEVFVAHAMLASLLIVAFGTIMDTGRVPGSVVVVGVLGGLAWSLVLPAHFVEGGGLLGVIVIPTLLRVVNGLLWWITGRDVYGTAPVAVALLAGGFVGWQVSLVALILATPAAMSMRPRRGEELALALTLSLVAAWQAYPTLIEPWVRGWWFGLLPAIGLALVVPGLVPLTPPAPSASPR